MGFIFPESMPPANLCSVAGLVYDIVGATLIALAIVGTRHEAQVSQAHHGGDFSGANLSLFAALEDQRRDARFGLFFLILGFLMQLAASIGWTILVSWIWGSVFVVAGMIILAWWYLKREFLNAARRDRLAASLDGMDKQNFLSRNPCPPRRRSHDLLVKLFG